MQKNVSGLAIGAALLNAGVAQAYDTEDPLKTMEKRLKYLEQRVHSQDHLIHEKDKTISVLQAKGEPATGWFQQVEIGGVLEVEAGHSSPYTGQDESDIVVATAEIGIAARINDWFDAGITLLYEEDDTDLEVDVAVISVTPADAPWYITAGQQYLPFGSFNTNLVSDPLTLEIGESRETALLAGYESNGFGAALYVFNGDNQPHNGRDDHIDNWGTALGYHRVNDNGEFGVGIGYINDIGDSDGLSGLINDNLGNNDVADHVSGWTAATLFVTGPFTFIAEYTAATDSFTAAEVPWRATGAEPRTWNLEAGYDFTLMDKDATFAVACQGSAEALALELPRRRLAAAVSVSIMENTAVGFEWAHDRDYSRNDGGTGNHSDTATILLAVEF